MTHASDPAKANTPLTALLEIKGEDSPQDQAKRAALAQWVQAVNEHGGFGTWAWDVVVGEAAGLRDVIDAPGAGVRPAAAQA